MEKARGEQVGIIGNLVFLKQRQTVIVIYNFLNDGNMCTFQREPNMFLSTAKWGSVSVCRN